MGKNQKGKKRPNLYPALSHKNTMAIYQLEDARASLIGALVLAANQLRLWQEDLINLSDALSEDHLKEVYKDGDRPVLDVERDTLLRIRDKASKASSGVYSAMAALYDLTETVQAVEQRLVSLCRDGFDD